MTKKQSPIPLERLDKYRWKISENYQNGMQVPGLVLTDELLLEKMKRDRTLQQCCNVAHLPGIYKYSITLPDGHEGYGFPIGGVAATDYEDGVISPGGVGYDINCGVRLLTTNFEEKDIRPKLNELGDTLFKNIPSGLGSRQKRLSLSINELDNLVAEGTPWLIKKGMGWAKDVKHCEEEGCMEISNPEKVSITAKKRGVAQVGTLGSGNHFLEVAKVDRIHDSRTAKTFGIEYEGQITTMIHCGSRGFGHQVCSDYLRVMEQASRKYGITLPDRELACAPGISEEGSDYYQAMACAVNYAFSNRQAITHWVRESFKEVFHKSSENFGLNLVYDVAHNIAKIEDHEVDGYRRRVWVHRKGATRSFGKGADDVPSDYRATGQPVFIPGTMGSSSWVMVGTKKALEISFGSTAHGAGRLMSRAAAKKKFWGGAVKENLEKKGIVVKSASQVILAEEAAGAYKDVDRVAEVSDGLGLACKVARLVPLMVIKG